METYKQFINEPKHLVNPVRDVWLFSNRFLELNSKTPAWIMPICWIPYHLWSLYNYEATPEVSFAVFLYGILSWTLAEYILHRFMFHGEDNWMHYIPDSNYVFTLHFMVHGIHHAFP